jgi:predicted nucleotidyltransferase
VFTPDGRARLRDALLSVARADERISGAALTGSAASGSEDRWSDIDLALAGALVRSLDMSELTRAFLVAVEALVVEIGQVDPGVASRLSATLFQLAADAAAQAAFRE